jgi:hypothetical protein
VYKICYTFLHNKFFLFLYFTDIDECLSDPCHVNANCSDNEGSYDCQCIVGYSVNGFNCSSKQVFCYLICVRYFTFPQNKFFLSLSFTDIDECLSDPCHINANCSDNEGSYDCQCNLGYSGNGFNCSSKQVFCYLIFLKYVIPFFITNFSYLIYISFTDIDECLSDPCHINANCSDNEGSYDCQCIVGYSGNGFNCSSKQVFCYLICVRYFTFPQNKFFVSLSFTDIDECLSDPCHINANCSDNEGSYDCQCDVGYSGNGFNCSSKQVFCCLICLKYFTFPQYEFFLFLYIFYRH